MALPFSFGPWLCCSVSAQFGWARRLYIRRADVNKPPMTDSPNITPASWIMVASLGFVWGGTFLLISIALEGMSPFWLAAYRIAFATALTVAVWQARGGQFHLSEERNWPAMLLVGILSTALPFMLLSWGIQFVTSGLAGVSMAAVALMVLPLAHFYLPGERMSLRRVFGFVIGFVGIVILLGPEAFRATGSEYELWGRLACLAAAACYAISSVTMRKLPPVDSLALSAVPLLFGTFLVVPVAWIVEGPPPMPAPDTLFVMAILGLFPTAGANLLRVLVIRSAGPVFMSLTNYQVPLWSVFLGVLVLGEPLRPSLLIALVLILAGVALSQWGALKRLFGQS